MVKIIVAALSAGVASAFGTISEFPTELTSLMDQTVDPCTDFYSYSWGTWCNKTTLDANQSRTDTTYTAIEAAAHELVEKLVDSKLPKLAEFYDACMDTAALDTLCLAPISSPTMTQVVLNRGHQVPTLGEPTRKGIVLLVVLGRRKQNTCPTQLPGSHNCRDLTLGSATPC
ncbi:hypothetical protein DYB31_008511 [Aphanomyces astaci]|uniref:Peptidase M13 N-terminal domain-containing protein n=1 Tax=Aphanomyces astaci TaxID=112090 RepID=A0A397EI05_APHAT|nr:hypothetical protein DYB31_008511 [Aphanomyces astaci]